MTALISYLKHVRVELAHVAWPSTRTAVSHTLVVIFITIVLALWVGLLDYLFTMAVGFVIGA
mgnify:CR=1 FL=1